MSVALALTNQLSPEIRLAEAVSLFEADLSDQQKADFRVTRSQSISTPPQLSNVMQLTAELERRVSQGSRNRQGFGPRLTNFLEAVQQFAALGDIITGGSQNMVACGVWSLVRMSLLVRSV